MIKRSIQLIILVATIGLIASCAKDPNIESAKLNLKQGDYNATLESLDKALAQDSTNATAYYFKGVAYSELANDTSDMEVKNEYFTKMKDSFGKARKYYAQGEGGSGEMDRMDLMLQQAWSNQHNMGVKYVTNDSLMQEDDYLEKSEGYLNNAITVIPDSAVSHKVLAEVSAMQNDLDRAIESMSRSIKLTNKSGQDTAAINDYKRLAYFYQKQEEYENAANLIDEARDYYPQDIDLIRTMADVYLQLGQKDKALGIVEDLIEKEPNEPQYRLVYGTQIYQSVLNLTDSLDVVNDEIFEIERKIEQASDDADVSDLEKKLAQKEEQATEIEDEVQDLTDEALVHLKKVTELRDGDAQAYNTIGIVYQNRAAAIFDKRNRTDDNEKAAEFDKQARKILKKAQDNYEQAVDIDPDNKDYWNNLFKVYTTLGMEKKAEEAMEKAGLK